LHPDTAELPFQNDELREFIYPELCRRALAERTTVTKGFSSTNQIYREIFSTKTSCRIFEIIRRDKDSSRVKFFQSYHISILRAGIAEICSPNGMSTHSPILKVVCGLALIGVAVHTWKQNRRCTYCFRVPALGKKYCNEHLVNHSFSFVKNELFNQDVKHHRGSRAATALKRLEDPVWIRYCNNCSINIDKILINIIYSPCGGGATASFNAEYKSYCNLEVRTESFERASLIASVEYSSHIRTLFGEIDQ
jgi:hypothetical protein